VHGPSGYDDVDPCLNQLGCILRDKINVLLLISICAPLDREVLTFNETAALRRRARYLAVLMQS
jgi:hypothetical protein